MVRVVTRTPQRERFPITMTLKAGELYFIGELDHRTQKTTPFVKIGIVKEHEVRDTSKRLKEHQTGNPRQIVELAVLATPNVERVETTMHGLYAPYGVGGEWFERSGDDLTATIRHAGELVTTMRGAEAALNEAERLVKVESAGDPLTPDSTTLDQHRRLLEFKAVESAIDQAGKAVRSALAQAHSQGLAVDRFVSVQIKQSAAAFDKERFEREHPEVYAQFLADKQRMAQRFNTVSDKGLDVSLQRLAPVVAALVGEIDAAVHSAGARDESAASLHQHYLQLLVEQASVDLEIELLTAVLKATCGEFPGIAGVCTWKRQSKTETKLDESALKREHSDLYASYLAAKPPTTAIVVARNRGYAW